MKNSILFFAFVALLTTATSCRGNNQENRVVLNPFVQEVYTTKTTPSTRNIQVALLLDTSNSMDGLIEQAKAQLWEIVNELSYAQCGRHTIRLEIALYEYGNDLLPAEEGFIKQVLPFSENLDEISKELFALTTNGGNEYCGKVIHTAINQLTWKKSNDDLKLIFIAGNEPFTQGNYSYKDAATDALEKGITVNTIFCGNYRQGIDTAWKDGADRTYGEYSAIDHNNATVHIATPYDDAILQLNNKLNKTYIHYGHAGLQKKSLQKEQDRNARSYSSANAVSRTVSKSSKFYKNSEWDLVDAIEESDLELDEVVVEELPKELRSKSKSELKKYVDTQVKNRTAIQHQIQELNKKRMVYIKQNRKTEESNLEDALLSAIKKQGKQKSFSWE